MRPAFDSTQQAAAFVLLLLLLLAAPWLAGKRLLPPREQAYASEGWMWGPYPWVQKQIFEETNDIDIAFIGSSHIMYDIDTPYVQRKLDERLGRKTVVRSICWGGAGFDELFFITRDLLAHRRVNTLVFYDESFGQSSNLKATHWFRFGDDFAALLGLPLSDQSVYYFAAMVGMPRNLLELLTPNLPEDASDHRPVYYQTAFNTDNPESRLGSLNARICYAYFMGGNTNFVLYAPHTGVTPSDNQTYTPATASNFVFLSQPLPAWQTHFAKQFGLLAKEHGVKLVLLHLPILAEKGSRIISEPGFWQDWLSTEVTMIGIPTGRLFAGLSESEIELLYLDPWHMNLNGQEYYTPLITPPLIQLYESRPNN